MNAPARPVPISDLKHDGVFQQNAYGWAIIAAHRQGQLLQDIETGALVFYPEPAIEGATA